jgi:hypothetical protein
MYKYFHLENSINTKKFSFMIPIENLKPILFFSLKIDQLSMISSLFFSFESDKTFLACIFWNAYLLVFIIKWSKFEPNCKKILQRGRMIQSQNLRERERVFIKNDNWIGIKSMNGKFLNLLIYDSFLFLNYIVLKLQSSNNHITLVVLI